MVVEIIGPFRGEYAFLSNFYLSPIVYAGLTWPTVEHAFQAAKSLSVSEREGIRACRTPAEAKWMGRHVALRSDWATIRVSVMEHFLRLKFAPGSDLAKRLIATGNARIVEYNTWHDNIWGQCTCSRHKDLPGSNFLGELLMKIRDPMVAEQFRSKVGLPPVNNLAVGCGPEPTEDSDL